MSTPSPAALDPKTYPEPLDAQLDALEKDAAVKRFSASRERLASDPYRPLYHFSPPGASLAPDVYPRTPEIGPFELADDESLHLRVFLDRSLVEVFGNGRQCLTLRAYPSGEDSRGVSACARGGEARLVSLRAWSMRSVWPALRGKEGPEKGRYLAGGA